MKTIAFVALASVVASGKQFLAQVENDVDYGSNGHGGQSGGYQSGGKTKS